MLDDNAVDPSPVVVVNPPISTPSSTDHAPTPTKPIMAATRPTPCLPATNNNNNDDNKKRKKPRYSRQEKRERKEEESSSNKKVRRSIADRLRTQRLLSCARRALSTRSVILEEAPTKIPSSRIRVITCSNLYESRRQVPPLPPPLPSYTTTNPTSYIRIQPLLILDLNGILCHRSRRHKEPPGVHLRPALGLNIAQTPIIPRTDLVDWLSFLEKHFCLAIWTSAQRHTAQQLLQRLVPHYIQDRFLFVWTQSDCHAVVAVPVSNDEDDDDREEEDSSPKKKHKKKNVVYQKDLNKVWKTFSLWNANNTLLLDDSPEKCDTAVTNALHPPAIHGQTRPPPRLCHDDDHHVWKSDSENESCQRTFFRAYSRFWQQTVHCRTVGPDGDDEEEEHFDSQKTTTMMTHDALYQFLREYATGHMGWRSSLVGDKEKEMEPLAPVSTPKTSRCARDFHPKNVKRR